MEDILKIVAHQLAAQQAQEDALYTVSAEARDKIIEGMTPRQRAHAKLAFGILDRIFNSVRCALLVIGMAYL